MIRRVEATGLGLLLVASAAVACSARELSGDGGAPLPARPYGAAYVDSLPSEASLLDPSGACRSAVPAGTVLAPNLRPEQVVLTAVACGHVTSGDSMPRLVTRQAHGVVLDRLVAALRTPSARTDGICDLSGRSIPVFAVQLQDGYGVNPNIPSDGCHPRDPVLRALREVIEQP